jgi:hypothetical protein
MSGMSDAELDLALDRAEAALEPCDIRPEVFVPPFNQFDARQYAVLARRYAVVCGGPETASTMGLRLAPRWIGDAVYLPSYPPLYGRAAPVTAAVQELAAQRAAVWAPVTLHVGWELDEGLRSLAVLARELAPLACSWDEFLAAVQASREPLDSVV